MISFAEKEMELEIILLSEVSQTQKDKYHIFLSYAESENYEKGDYLTRGRGPMGTRRDIRKSNGGSEKNQN
jgi:hypothetical protein